MYKMYCEANKIVTKTIQIKCFCFIFIIRSVIKISDCNTAKSPPSTYQIPVQNILRKNYQIDIYLITLNIVVSKKKQQNVFITLHKHTVSR